MRKRVKLKVWGVVFCCMASRAIHADVVGDQSTEGFLLAYQRFTAEVTPENCGQTTGRTLWELNLP